MKTGAHDDLALVGRIEETSSEKPMTAERFSGSDKALDDRSRLPLDVNAGAKTLSLKYPGIPLAPPVWPR